LEESIGLCRRLGERRFLAEALYWRGYLAGNEGDCETARVCAEESLSLAQTCGSGWILARVTAILGYVALNQGDYDTAQSLLKDCLRVHRQAGDKRYVAEQLSWLGTVAYLQGDCELAQAYYEESIQIWREEGNKLGAAADLAKLAYVMCRQDQAQKTEDYLAEMLALCQAMTWMYPGGVTAYLVGWAGLAQARAQPERAARLLGAAKAVQECVDRQLTVLCPHEHERIASDVRAELDEMTLNTAWAEGRAVATQGWECVIAYARRQTN
jgi:tetratricopeptide (TPR) repeat protein